jgi:polyisoprenoid-binding protein YceI
MGFRLEKCCQTALVLLVIGASTVLGQQSSEPREAYAPGDVELTASRVYVHVGKTGFGHEHAVMGQLQSGSIRLGATENAGKLVFDMSNFTADEDVARKYLRLHGTTNAEMQSKVTANMLGPHVLDVANFQTVEFEVRSARRLAEPSQRGLAAYEFQGTLTLHAVSRPVTFVAEVEHHGGWDRLVGRFAILQSDFGIQPYTAAFGAVGVADQLTIYGDLWLVPQDRRALHVRSDGR